MEEARDPAGVLAYPLATEKATMMIEKQNIITYVVDIRATKPQIKRAVESMFGVKVSCVRCETTMHNVKKAFVRLAKPYNASDVAEKLKLV